MTGQKNQSPNRIIDGTRMDPDKHGLKKECFLSVFIFWCNLRNLRNLRIKSLGFFPQCALLFKE